MSWDLHMEIDVGGREPHRLAMDSNCTWNLGPMFKLAFTHDYSDDVSALRSLDKMAGCDAFPLIASALHRMQLNPDDYRELNPKNGWGDYEGACKFLHEILCWCKEAPRAILRVS